MDFWKKAHKDAVLFYWHYLKDMGYSEEEKKVLENE